MIFANNAWYMFGWADELVDKPVTRQILCEQVVLFRDASGNLAALEDACPHRAVPLSLGSVNEGRIKCPYHGLEFDGGGVCRFNPHISGPPDRLKVRAFPAVERYGAVWVWMGAPQLADPDAIVSLDWFDTASYDVCRGTLHISADYRLVIDNLMDLAHAEYIHSDTVGTPGASAVVKNTLNTDSDRVTVSSFLPNTPPTSLFKHIWTKTDRVDKYSDISWNFPSVLTLDLGIMAPGEAREDGIRAPSTHILTPETETSTHYFWAFSRDFARNDLAVSAMISSTVARAFNEQDKPVLEAAQKVLNRKPVKLASFSVGDAGAARVRKELDRAIQAE